MSDNLGRQIDAAKEFNNVCNLFSPDANWKWSVTLTRIEEHGPHVGLEES